MRVLLNPCYILHQRSYRETSLILDLFSRNYGKVVVVARGVKRKKSRSAALLQLHQRLNISWNMRGEMGTLTGVESDGLQFDISGRWLFTAFYIDELLVRLLHKHEDHPELFDAYDRALSRLDQQEAEFSTVRAFEVQLLQSLGYGLVLDHDVDTGRGIDPGQEYYYVLDHGPVITPPAHADYVRISGRALVSLHLGDYQDDSLMCESKLLMQKVLQTYLGHKPLRSRELYQAYVEKLSR